MFYNFYITFYALKASQYHTKKYVNKLYKTSNKNFILS